MSEDRPEPGENDSPLADPETAWLEVWQVHPAAVEERLQLLEARGLHPIVPHVPSSILSKFYGSMTVKIYVPESEHAQAMSVVSDYEIQATSRADALVKQIVPVFVGVTVLAVGVAVVAASLGLQLSSSIMLGCWVWLLSFVVSGIRQRRSR